MMNRKERRAAAHKELKLARKARFAVATPPESQALLGSGVDPNLTSNDGGADALVRGRRPGRPSPTAEPPLSAFPSLSSISLAQLTANRANAASPVITAPSSFYRQKTQLASNR